MTVQICILEASVQLQCGMGPEGLWRLAATTVYGQEPWWSALGRRGEGHPGSGDWLSWLIDILGLLKVNVILGRMTGHTGLVADCNWSWAQGCLEG